MTERDDTGAAPEIEMSAAALPEPSDPIIGKRVLGRYRIVRLLATGGMGKVYLGRTEGAAGFVMPVVIKRVLPELVGDDAMLKMFVREAQTLAGLRHPGIVAVHDFAKVGVEYFMAMEFVRGHPVGRWLRYYRRRGGRFPIECAVQIALQVLDALQYAHSLTGPDGKPNPVVHRDVTPGNILVSTEGHVKLLDFGIARSQTDATVPSAEGPTIKGKFPYIAPEIFQGADPTPSTDVYSVAMTLHELILGRNEMIAKDLPRMMANVLQRTPTRLDEGRADVSQALADVVARGLAKSPAERYKTAAEFAAALRSCPGADPSDARQRLAAQAMLDYEQAAASPEFGLENLSELDSAWREAPLSLPPSSGARSDPPVRKTTSSAPTAVASRADLQPPRGKGVLIAVVATALVVVSAAVVAVVYVLRKPSVAPGGQVVYVNAGGSEGEPDAESREAPRPDTGTLSGSTAPSNDHRDDGIRVAAPPQDVAVPTVAAHVPAGTNTAPHIATPADAAALLTRRFTREQGRIRRCFESNSTDVAGRDAISVRFEVEATGTVADARLVPSELGATAFGTCVLGIARAIDFGARAERVAFRIPLQIERVPAPR